MVGKTDWDQAKLEALKELGRIKVSLTPLQDSGDEEDRMTILARYFHDGALKSYEKLPFESSRRHTRLSLMNHLIGSKAQRERKVQHFWAGTPVYTMLAADQVDYLIDLIEEDITRMKEKGL